MKIIKSEEFKKLPRGTIFMKYEPCVFEELCIKGDTFEYDFWHRSINHCVDGDDTAAIIESLEAGENFGDSIPMDFESEMRDGCFDEGQLYAVFEKKDVDDFIGALMKCRDGVYKAD